MSRAFNHTIAGNKGNERPTRVIFLDVESRVSEPHKGVRVFTPFLWVGACVKFEDSKMVSAVYSHGEEVGEFWDCVDNFCYPKTKVYLTSHHLEVDFIPLQGFKHLQERGWVLKLFISHGRTLIMNWSKPGKKLVVINNGNIFAGSIDQWGKMIGLEKLPMPRESDPLEVWLPYCTRDVEVIAKMWEYLFMFLDGHNLGNFKLSAAGLAFNAYRHRFMSIPVSIHDDAEVIKLEREGYHGGRFQAVQIGDFSGDTFRQLDINSMYGSIMAREDLPYELRGYRESIEGYNLAYYVDRYAVIAEVEIYCWENVFPHFEGNKLGYGAGSFTTVLTTPELAYCLENGWIQSVGRIAWYTRGKVLASYASYFLDLKDKYDAAGNTPMRQLSKLYLNGLYGKFGQRGYNDRVIGDCDPNIIEIRDGWDLSLKCPLTILKYGGRVHECYSTDAARDAMIALAAHITAYGRLQIHQLALKADYGNVYHIATDSLTVNSEGYENLKSELSPRQPGKLKIEDTFSVYTVFDVNDQEMDGVRKIKGISKKSAQTDINAFLVTYWTKLETLIKIGKTDQYYVREVEKHLRRGSYYDKQAKLFDV